LECACSKQYWILDAEILDAENIKISYNFAPKFFRMNLPENKKNTITAGITLAPIALNRQPKVYIETYGCQMNVSDSEVVMAILKADDFIYTDAIGEADLILINTCSIRDNAEQRIRGRLHYFKKFKKGKNVLVGVLGCMAERLKEKLLEEEKLVDLVVGPDAYRDLPNLVNIASGGQKAINVLLSREETYAEINPVRYDSNGISAFVSIMRGCNNMCAYCVVPYTRGGERSRNPKTIGDEIKKLSENGFREVTLLGQNVNSFNWHDEVTQKTTNFAKLLEMIAATYPQLRIRFFTSHPKDLTDDVLYVIAKYPNLCKSIHLPAQSGSTRVLKLMNRGYTREWYLDRIHAIKRILPDSTITTDIIAGFCSETEEDHNQTLSLMKEVGYDLAFMFAYSERPKTYAQRKLSDDVPEETKSRRLQEIIDLQRQLSEKSKSDDLGKTVEVLVEGTSKKKKTELYGRTSQNKTVVFPAETHKKGDYVNVKITAYTSGTLKGRVII
jgi:tRNA-2-methylthio-N6-dimethylallyladenosine synthase